MKIHLPRDTFKAHDLGSSQNEEEEVKWDRQHTQQSLKAEETALKEALQSLLEFHDMPEDELPLHSMLCPSRTS